jgi:site-specific DNA recombinase
MYELNGLSEQKYGKRRVVREGRQAMMISNGNAMPGSERRRSAVEAAKKRDGIRPPRTTAVANPTRGLPVAFSYLRVSTKEQARMGGGAEGYSIPTQRAACIAKAASLGAVISPEHEYVDAGESAKSADREDLQRMLSDIKRVRPDYLIVHKVDRLARNRADDIAINMLLKKYGVTLVSCMENIDDTPSGRLLYGLLAEIAQFYSGNLAQEVMKGLIRKAEEGGTPFRAPTGYVNHREKRGGVERAWVELDELRAEIIRWCFEQYATGEWSGIDLTMAARARGLTSRPTTTQPAHPISETTMYHILQNPYYMGVVVYQGIHYEGTHPALVEPDVWLAVQDLLAAHAHLGEKDRVHRHYLRGSIFCSNCGGRLVYSQSKGNGGTYAYYLCVKKKTKDNGCTRPAVRLERIEDGIAAFYRRFHIRPEAAEKIRAAVRAELSREQSEARSSFIRAAKRKEQVQGERQKLIRAHYAGAVPQDLLASEMQRFTRALAEADAEIAAAKTSTSDVEATLDAALNAAAACQATYLAARPHIRKQINQGFFKRLLIGEDGSVARAELTEPFGPLLDIGTAATPADDPRPAVMPAPARGKTSRSGDGQTDDTLGDAERTRPTGVFLALQGTNISGGMITGSTQTNTDRTVICTVGGVNQTSLVGTDGLEPPTSAL